MNLEVRVSEAVDREAQGVLNSFQELQKDAQTVVRLQQKLELRVDPTLLLITRVGVPERDKSVPLEEIWEPVAQEVPVKPTPKSKREQGYEVQAAKRKAKGQKELEERAQLVLHRLDTLGPGTLKELMTRTPDISEYQMGMALRYLKKQGLAFNRTLGFQGSTAWYTPYRPVYYQHELKNYIINLPKGEVVPSKIVDRFNLVDSAETGVVKMLRALVNAGEITRREGKFFKETPQPRSTNGKKDHKANFGGAGVATGGDLVSSNKEVRDMAARAKAKGAQVDAGKTHIKVSYMGRSTIIGKTPSPQGLKEDRANLKAIGLNV